MLANMGHGPQLEGLAWDSSDILKLPEGKSLARRHP